MDKLHTTKLDLVAECFAGLTHGFWQHENRNNH